MCSELLAADGGSLRCMPILSALGNSPAAQTSSLEFLKISIPLRLRHTEEHNYPFGHSLCGLARVIIDQEEQESPQPQSEDFLPGRKFLPIRTSRRTAETTAKGEEAEISCGFTQLMISMPARA